MCNSCLFQVRFLLKNISLLLGHSEVGREKFQTAFRQQLERQVRPRFNTNDLEALLRSADEYVLPLIGCILEEFAEDEKRIHWIR